MEKVNIVINENKAKLIIGEIVIEFNNCSNNAVLKENNISDLYENIDFASEEDNSLLFLKFRSENISNFKNIQMQINKSKLEVKVISNNFVISNNNQTLEIIPPYIEDSSHFQYRDTELEIEEKENKLLMNFGISDTAKDGITYPATMWMIILRKEVENKTEDTVSNSSEEINNEVFFEEKEEDIFYDIPSEEIIVRKKICSFVENMMVISGYELNHDTFKATFYREKTCESKEENEVKNYYDAFIYLIGNYKNLLTEELLIKFIFLVTGEKLNDNTVSKICDTYYTLRKERLSYKTSYMLMYTHELLKGEVNEKERLIISLMLMNYIIANNNNSTLKVNRSEYPLLKNAMENYHESPEELEKVINALLGENKKQGKEYYSELSETEYEDIKAIILKDKDEMKEYHIEHVYVFGSVAKGTNRIDSDIDMIFLFSLDADRNDIRNAHKYYKNKYFQIFKRYIDITCKTKNNVSDKELNEKEIF